MTGSQFRSLTTKISIAIVHEISGNDTMRVDSCFASVKVTYLGNLGEQWDFESFKTMLLKNISFGATGYSFAWMLAFFLIWHVKVHCTSAFVCTDKCNTDTCKKIKNKDFEFLTWLIFYPMETRDYFWLDIPYMRFFIYFYLFSVFRMDDNVVLRDYLLNHIKRGKSNAVILSYLERDFDLFIWYD